MKIRQKLDYVRRSVAGTVVIVGVLFLMGCTLTTSGNEESQTSQLAGKPFHVSARSFENMVLEAETPVLVDFWAPWCGPCLTMAPWLEEISAEYGDRLRVVKLNVDENPGLARRYEIMGLPTLVLFHEGEEVDRLIGLLSKRSIKRRVEPKLPSS